MYIDDLQGLLAETLLPTTTIAAPTLFPTAQPTPTSLPTVVPTRPHFHYEVAGNTGKTALWVVTVLMGLSSLAFYTLAARVPVQKRLLHVLTAFITTFAFISYYSMATGDGVSFRRTYETETKQHIVTDIYSRQIFFARYIDWVVTTPLLLVDLSLIAGLNGASITVAIVADVIMVLTGLFAAYGKIDSQRWGWYTISCLAFLVIVYQLAANGRRTVANKDVKTKRFYSALGGFTLILWTIYPIVWAVADGAGIVGVDGEILAYAILDLLAKPVFGFWLLTTHDKLSSSSLSIEGFWSHGASSEGALRVGDDDDV